MWRRHGDAAYTLLVLGIFTIEALALGVLVWTFALRAGGLRSGSSLNDVLIGAVVTTALGLLGITVYILGYHALSALRERRRDELLGKWTERWIAVVIFLADCPKPPLRPEAEDAALELRAILKGEDGLALSALLEVFGVDRRLTRKMGSRRLALRLEALEELAKGRFRGAFYSLIPLLADGEPVVRLMSGRALARTLAEWPSGPERDRATAAFSDAIEAAALPAGATDEVLLLLEDSARPVLAALLENRSDRASLVRGALDATGRLGLVDLKKAVVPWASHADPEVRAAALRALGRLGRVPDEALDSFVAAFADDVEFVRVQAAHAAVGLSEPVSVALLIQSLGDLSWWVRRASAESLLRVGVMGRAALRQAAQSHPDRYARGMSAQVLADAAQSDSPDFERLEEFV